MRLLYLKVSASLFLVSYNNILDSSSIRFCFNNIDNAIDAIESYGLIVIETITTDI